MRFRTWALLLGMAGLVGCGEPAPFDNATYPTNSSTGTAGEPGKTVAYPSGPGGTAGAKGKGGGGAATEGGGGGGGGGMSGPSMKMPGSYPKPVTTTPDSSKTAEKDDGEAAKTDADKAEEPKPEATKPDEPGKDEEPKAAAVELSAEEIAEIKKLPADEQAAALKQAVCPVSDEHLGSMEMPIKVTANGKSAYLCCGGCKKAFDKDPAKFLSKLGIK